MSAREKEEIKKEEEMIRALGEAKLDNDDVRERMREGG